MKEIQLAHGGGGEEMNELLQGLFKVLDKGYFRLILIIYNPPFKIKVETNFIKIKLFLIGILSKLCLF